MKPDSLPQYRSHKVVRAGQIERVFETAQRLTLTVDGDKIEVMVPSKFFARGTPKTGDYYILYPDGYESWSPAKEFEEGYMRMAQVGQQQP